MNNDLAVVLVLLAAGALFVIGEGLVRTGVAQRLGDWLLKAAGSNETRLVVLLMASVAGLGAFMSSTGVVAIFIPVALRIAQGTGTAPSQLMMPLSAAALISGMLTLVATAPNLVVNSELARHGLEGFHVSFTPFGLPVLVLGVVYMLFARRWLGTTAGSSVDRAPRPSFREWIERYKLAEREYRLRVTDRSPFAGRALDELDLRRSAGVDISRHRSSASWTPLARTPDGEDGTAGRRCSAGGFAASGARHRDVPPAERSRRPGHHRRLLQRSLTRDRDGRSHGVGRLRVDRDHRRSTLAHQVRPDRGWPAARSGDV
jgi:hypothetical protein